MIRTNRSPLPRQRNEPGKRAMIARLALALTGFPDLRHKWISYILCRMLCRNPIRKSEILHEFMLTRGQTLRSHVAHYSQVDRRQYMDASRDKKIRTSSVLRNDQVERGAGSSSRGRLVAVCIERSDLNLERRGNMRRERTRKQLTWPCPRSFLSWCHTTGLL